MINVGINCNAFSASIFALNVSLFWEQKLSQKPPKWIPKLHQKNQKKRRSPPRLPVEPNWKYFGHFTSSNDQNTSRTCRNTSRNVKNTSRNVENTSNNTSENYRTLDAEQTLPASFVIMLFPFFHKIVAKPKTHETTFTRSHGRVGGIREAQTILNHLRCVSQRHRRGFAQDPHS